MRGKKDNPTPPKERSPGKPKGKTMVPMSVIIADLKSGKTPKQIAEAYGLVPESIRARLRNNGFSIHGLKAYQQHRADIFAHVQSRMIDAMTPDKINKTGIRDLAVAANNLHTMERLERNLSTGNVSIANIGSELADIDAQILLLENKNPPENSGGND